MNYKKLNINLVLIAAIVAGGGWLAYKFFGPSDTEKTENANKKDLNTTLKKKGVTQSYMDANYYAWADQLFNSMKYLGTDEGLIKSIIGKMRNDADVLKLLQAFGTRNYFYGFYPYNLPQWFAEELSEADITAINSILNKAGISFKF